jgi:hypothetical protein
MDERTILQSGTRGVVDLEARRPTVSLAIREALGSCLTETSLSETVPLLGPKTRGKVRDTYEAGDYLVLVTTDRQSAFDRVLASVPFKGQVQYWCLSCCANVPANCTWKHFDGQPDLQLWGRC